MIATRWPSLSAKVGVLLVALAVAGSPGQILAQEKKLPPSVSREMLDNLIVDSVVKAVNDGADIYNADNATGSVFFFRGSLAAVRPLLKDRPELQQKMDRDVKRALARLTPSEQAYDLREALINIRVAIEFKEAVVAKTLWDRLGGEDGVKHIVNRFIDAAVKDPTVNFDRDGKYPMTRDKVAELKEHFVALAAQISGGEKPEYKGRLMSPIHKDMGITDKEFDAMIAHLTKALYFYQVKQSDVDTLLAQIERTRRHIVGPPAVVVKPVIPPGPGVPPPPPPPPAAEKTLWESLGKQKGVEAIVNQVIDEAIADPAVNFGRGKKLPEATRKQIKKQFVILVSMMSGGPDKYDGEKLIDIHREMKITNAEYEAFQKHIKKALKDNNIATDAIDNVMEATDLIREKIVAEKAKAP